MALSLTLCHDDDAAALPHAAGSPARVVFGLREENGEN
jgi:hypothetical protein